LREYLSTLYSGFSLAVSPACPPLARRLPAQPAICEAYASFPKQRDLHLQHEHATCGKPQIDSNCQTRHQAIGCMTLTSRMKVGIDLHVNTATRQQTAASTKEFQDVDRAENQA